MSINKMASINNIRFTRDGFVAHSLVSAHHMRNHRGLTVRELTPNLQPILSTPTPPTIISTDAPFIERACGVRDSSSNCHRMRDRMVEAMKTNKGRVASTAATRDAGPRL